MLIYELSLSAVIDLEQFFLYLWRGANIAVSTSVCALAYLNKYQLSLINPRDGIVL